MTVSLIVVAFRLGGILYMLKIGREKEREEKKIIDHNRKKEKKKESHGAAQQSPLTWFFFTHISFYLVKKRERK